MSDRVCCGVCGFFECNCPDKNPESDYNRMAKPIVITHPCPSCAKLQAELQTEKERADKAASALSQACQELADHQCPEEFGLALWGECVTCPKGKEARYDAQRDVDCWRRYLQEQVGERALGEGVDKP